MQLENYSDWRDCAHHGLHGQPIDDRVSRLVPRLLHRTLEHTFGAASIQWHSNGWIYDHVREAHSDIVQSDCNQGTTDAISAWLASKMAAVSGTHSMRLKALRLQKDWTWFEVSVSIFLCLRFMPIIKWFIFIFVQTKLRSFFGRSHMLLDANANVGRHVLVPIRCTIERQWFDHERIRVPQQFQRCDWQCHRSCLDQGGD